MTTVNIEAYDEELDLALGHFRMPVPEQVRDIIRGYEIRLMDQVVDLLADRVLKMPATPRSLAYLRNGVVEALEVLGAVLVAGRAWPGTPAEDIALLEDLRFSMGVKINEMRRLSVDKNNDYSPYNIFKSGNLGLATRMGDKISRIHNAVVAGVELRVADENIVQTSLDLVNYAVYQVMVARDVWVTWEERRAFLDYLVQAGGDHMASMYQQVGDGAVRVLGPETDGAPRRDERGRYAR